MAKLHSWVFSNSSRCAGVITLSTMSRLCCGVSGVCVIGLIFPFTFIDGGMAAVMNRSDAFWCAISLRNEVKSMVLMTVLRDREPGIGKPRRPGPMPFPLSRAIPVRSWGNTGNTPLPSPVPVQGPGPASLEQALVLGVFPGLVAGDQAALDQVLQILVEGLHAHLLAGLDRRIHLRHLVLADQVADGRGGHHDLVRGDAAAADLLQQRLRD